MTRPAVDIVVPVAGTPEQLRDIVRRMRRLELREDDTLTVVDNRPPGGEEVAGMLRAPERQSSYFARNRGAAAGRNPWLVFLDGDVDPPGDLVARYFAEPVEERVAVMAGGVMDEPLDPAGERSAVARYAMLRAPMSQSVTLTGPRPYAQTANCAVRRAAFEEVGGFRDDIRSGGDADFCWRIADAGWDVVGRGSATVIHRSRRTLRALLRQRARHGAGAAWLRREYPGAMPPARWLGLAKWTLTSYAGAGFALMRGRRDDALLGAIDPLCGWAFELGRFFGNEVPSR